MNIHESVRMPCVTSVGDFWRQSIRNLMKMYVIYPRAPYPLVLFCHVSLPDSDMHVHRFPHELTEGEVCKECLLWTIKGGST